MREAIECNFMRKVLLFQKAVKKHHKDAIEALREEVMKVVKMDMWDPLPLPDMSQ